MYFSILNSNNKPILSAKLKHFSLHTSATESWDSKVKYDDDANAISIADAVYNTYLEDVLVLDEDALLAFENIHRLDHTSSFSGEKSQNDRSFYVFIQPKLRGDYNWNITQSGYVPKLHNL